MLKTMNAATRKLADRRIFTTSIGERMSILIVYGCRLVTANSVDEAQRKISAGLPLLPDETYEEDEYGDLVREFECKLAGDQILLRELKDAIDNPSCRPA
jgi:hypothetical protein